MNEFLTTYLNSFSWAKTAYKRLLKGNTDGTVNVSLSDLSKNLADNLEPIPNAISDERDWNNATSSFMSNIAGIYSTVDKAESYLATFRHKMNSRLDEGNKTLNKLEASIRSVRSVLSNTSNTSISISGGDSSWVDLDQKYYVDAPQLKFIPEESCYRLPDTGFYSTIRSNGGMGGHVAIEKTLTPLEQVGNLSSIVDGSAESFWLASSYLPSLVKAPSGVVSWLPVNYTHGTAVLLSYFLDRPSLAGEVYVDPVTTEPFTLLSVSWTPSNILNSIGDTLFNGSSWSYVHGASQVASGSSSVSCAALSGSGGVYLYFNPLNLLATSLSGTTVDGSSSAGQRFEFTFKGKTSGEAVTGARVSWLDSGNALLSEDRVESVFSSFYSDYRVVSYCPSGAASGKIDFYVVTATTPATSYITGAAMYAGEGKWLCNQTISGETTISLPTPVTSNRFSFTCIQTSPRKESFVNKAQQPNRSIYTPLGIDPSITREINRAVDAANYIGPGYITFAYNLGLRELDLRYREYVPRATITTIPLKTGKEIRNLWVSADLDSLYPEGMGFYVIPFSKDDSFKIPIKPFLTGVGDTSGQMVQSQGEVLAIFTPEEEDAGWSVRSPLRIVSEPIVTKEIFDGTDKDGVVVLTNVPHLRRVRLRGVNDWLNTYSAWPTKFDPNAQTLTGIADPLNLALIRGGTNVSISQEDIATYAGYIPIKVTVATNSWTAQQDVLGKPDTPAIRSVVGEVLTSVAVSTVSTVVSSDYISFDTYLSTTLIDQLLGAGTNSGVQLSLQDITAAGLGGKSIKEVSSILSSKSVASSGGNKTLGGLLSALKISVAGAQKLSSAINTLAQKNYNYLKANRSLPKTQDTTVTKSTNLPALTAYRTQFNPVVSGGNGSLFRLYWATTDAQLVLSPSDYTLNASTGVVEVAVSMPDGYDQLMADYSYLNKTDETSFFSKALNLVNTPTSQGDVSIGPREYPICRNMTDYNEGTTPILRAPDMDPLSSTYYPVIEYYVTPGGRIQFSRDFFKYGDLSATVTVEQETLGIEPRLVIDTLRSSGAHTTPKLNGVSLKTREGNASPSRGTA